MRFLCYNKQNDGMISSNIEIHLCDQYMLALLRSDDMRPESFNSKTESEPKLDILV